MNLWADLPNSEHSQQAVDTIQQEQIVFARTARRPADSAVLSLLRNWLLQDYISSYCRALAATRIFRRCYWIDALGISPLHASGTAPVSPPPGQENGQSASKEKGRKKASSPAPPPALQPVLSLAHMLAQESKPISLQALLLAIGSSRRNGTRTGSPDNTADFSKGSAILQASWLEIAPSLLTEIASSPAIFLLNPLGSVLFSYEDLAPLLQRTVPTELCLLLPHKQIVSHLRAAQKDTSSKNAITQTTQPRSPQQALTALLRTDRWKTLSIDTEKQATAISSFISLLIAALQRHFQFPLQQVTLPLQVGPAHVEDAPYTLLFATRRQDSLYAMNDAISCHRQRIEEQSYQGVLSEEWFRNQQKLQDREARQQLLQRVLQQGRAQRVRRWPDLRQQLLLPQFGRFPMYTYDTVIRQLLAAGEVRCTWRGIHQESEADRVPGNDDTLIWRE